MKIDAEALKHRATDIYRDFTAGQRAMVVIAGLGLLVGGYLFMQWAAAPSWAPLYTNLEAEDAAAVTDELDSMGVSYQLADGGSTILVPRQDVYDTRLDLSAEGLPRLGADGWNLIDDQGLTTSEFRQRVDFQRAMEGELARTIAAIDAVSTANVHLVMPEDDLFSGDDVHPSASVLVDTGERPLATSQVQAIVHMVASSVEGLVPEYVTVADTSGRVLSAAGEDGLDVAAGEQRLAQKAAYESSVARSIQSLLEPITGAGRSRVVVSADLDFSQKESVTESFGEPDSAPVLSEDTSNETYVNANGEIVGGVLGPDAVPVADGEGGSEYNREDVTRTFAVDKVTEQVKAAPGSVERLSVAVLVDEAAGVNTQDIADLVTAGAGLVPARGDSIEVSAMAFGEPEALDLTGGTSSEEPADDMVLTLARIGGVVLLVLIVLLLAYRSARKSSLARYPVAIPLPNAADETASLLAELDDELERADAAAALEPAEPARHVVLQSQIGELIDRQPEDVAAVLRTWLADRRG